MTNRKAKVYATATVLGLGALGGVALGSNHGVPVVSGQTATGSGATATVATTTSGATAVVGSEATRSTAAGTRAPIVTRTSGAGTGHTTDD